MNRFDGYAFKRYFSDPADSNSIGSSIVNFIYQDSHGALWFSTQGGGVNRYLPERDGFRRYVSVPGRHGSLLSNNGSAIYEDREGTLWIGAGGLHRYDGATDSFVSFSPSVTSLDSLRSGGITFMLEDDDRRFWVGTTYGLHEFDRRAERFRAYVHDPANRQTLGSNHLTSVVDQDSVLWIGTMGGGLNRFHKRTASVRRFLSDPSGPFGPGINLVTEVVRDRHGSLWIGTWEGAGLLIFDPSRSEKPVFHQYRRDRLDQTSLSENRIFDMIEDKAGNFWIGTHNGLNKVRRTARFSQGLPGHQVTDLIRDWEGRIWVGTMGSGLFVLNSDHRPVRSISKRSEPGSLPTDFIQSLHVDDAGMVWAGAYREGLVSIDPRTFKTVHFGYAVTNERSPESVWRVLSNTQGRVWVDTDRGIRVLNEDKLLAPFEDRSAKSFRDNRGTLWRFDSAGFGPSSNGFDIRSHYAYSEEQFADHRRNSILSIARDSKEIVWILVDGYGLVRFDPSAGTMKNIDSGGGIESRSVVSLFVDQADVLWIGTVNGLDRFDPGTGKTRTFTEEDGLPSNTFYGNRAAISAAGEFVFGTVNGWTGFLPMDIVPNMNAPEVVLTSFSVLHEPVNFLTDESAIQELEITYRENVFSFEVAALDLTSPLQNVFEYKMEGFDERWLNARHRRYFTYTNLLPGSYTFRVRAANPDGVWSDEGTAVRLVITPPFWFRWWFLTAVGLSIAGIVVYLYNWRVERLLEIERTRDRIARDLHDDVASTLGSIALYSSTLRKRVRHPARTVADLLERIGRLSVEAVDTMGDIVWSVSPQHDSLQDLLTHVRDHVSQLCTASGMEYSLDISTASSDDKIDPELRKTVFLICKEALHNALQHSRATKVKVLVRIGEGRLRMCIEDNGVGFDDDRLVCNEPDPSAPNGVVRGHGLQSMRERAAGIGASFAIVSDVDRGTRVMLDKDMT